MSQSKSLEEGMAALATFLSNEALAAADSGEFGEEVRLLTLPERVRRSDNAQVA